MPTPKQMLWIVALAAGTYLALRTYENRAASTGGSGATRYGR